MLRDILSVFLPRANSDTCECCGPRIWKTQAEVWGNISYPATALYASGVSRLPPRYWLPVGVFWLPFGSQSAPFGVPLSWRPFGSLWVPLGVRSLPLAGRGQRPVHHGPDDCAAATAAAPSRLNWSSPWMCVWTAWGVGTRGHRHWVPFNIESPWFTCTE